MNGNDIAIGIDLGTVNSVFAINREGKTEVICFEDDKVVPSRVYFDPNSDNVLIGDIDDNAEAKRNISNAVFDMKRFIGRSYDDENVQKILKNYMFNIERSPTNEIHIPIKQNGNIVYKTPQDICSEILKGFKDAASEFLGCKVKDAVITVPAYFNFSQRNATKQAAELAGLNVLMLLSEPIAAYLHYKTERLETDSICLVFDLGGGTLDITIVKLFGNKTETINVDGDSFLGGRNFDETLLDYIISKKDLNLDKIQLRRLLTKIETCKKRLSFHNKYTVELMNLFKNETFSIQVKKKDFEEANQSLFQKCIDIIDRSLKNAKLKKQDINKIILVGGSTRIPKLRDMISNYFDGKELTRDSNPEEAIAAGAAIQAAAMRSSNKDIVKIIDVTPFSLGVDSYSEKMCKIIKSNTPIPAEGTKMFETVEDYTTNMSFNVYEGERSRCSLNNLLGTFTVKNLPSTLAGEVNVLVKFSVDESGLLKVTAKEESSNIGEELEIGKKLHGLKCNSIELADALKEDKLFENFVDEKLKLRRFCEAFCSKNRNHKEFFTYEDLITEIDDVEFENRDKLKEIENKISLLKLSLNM